MHEIFISYSHKDDKIANALLTSLETNKVKCWIDYRDAAYGLEYAASIVKAIKSCQIFLIVFSSNSNESKQVLNEVNSAVNSGKLIIPFKVGDFEIDDSFEYYLGKTHWLEAITPPLQKHIDVLTTKIIGLLAGEKASTDEEAPKKKQLIYNGVQEDYRMAKFNELLALGYTAQTIAMQLVENDYIVCNGIGEDNEGTVEQWAEILMNCSETFQYLLDSQNNIVGDWSIVALSDEKADLAIKGELLEKDLSYEETEFIGFPDVYNGYVLTFSILPQHRNAKNYMLIVKSWLKQLECYSSDGIYFRQWIINTFNKETEALVKKIGFKYLCDNKVFGKIYHITFMPLPNLPIIKEFPEMVNNYNTYDS